MPAFQEWGELDLNYKVVARIDPAKCIGCDLCFVACRDGAVHCIHLPDGGGSRAEQRIPVIDEPECVGCNLCASVCPVPGCITMTEIDEGKPFESWNDRVQSGS
ncbi:MAG: 4Fe-4S dicluster-binding protein [Candidatus Eisenbacteria bacterium]